MRQFTGLQSLVGTELTKLEEKTIQFSHGEFVTVNLLYFFYHFTGFLLPFRMYFCKENRMVVLTHVIHRDFYILIRQYTFS